jgi:ketosteroid isomerase-like protein
MDQADFLIRGIRVQPTKQKNQWSFGISQSMLKRSAYLTSTIFVLLISAPLLFSQDMEAEKAAIGKTIDNFDNAIKTQDVEALAEVLNENAMVCGTDPSEYWTKQEIVEMWREALSQGAPEFKYIDDRRIFVAPGGKSAVAVTQYIMAVWSPNIPWRQVYHLIKTEDTWEIFTINIAFVPKNEEIQAINAALDKSITGE